MKIKFQLNLSAGKETEEIFRKTTTEMKNYNDK